AQVGRTSGEKEKIDLNELVAESMDLIAPPANIRTEIETPLPVLYIEKSPIEQLFQNLLSNAVKYMDKPEGIIKIGAVEEAGFWKFYISDNGPGIEKEYFDRIFQLFQTLQARDQFESTGIGLTIVKKVVENFGGKVWVDSKPGEGTTFYFTLPKFLMQAGQ
ncbi:MAG TPA: ATP-binding protein, partial [Adhaeribacter sp.]|nr:ATP-binding protein [Adhaeribacter sp.]